MPLYNTRIRNTITINTLGLRIIFSILFVYRAQGVIAELLAPIILNKQDTKINMAAFEKIHMEDLWL